MKPQPIIVWSLLVVFGVLMIPTLTGWIVRDFLTQTMQVPSNFERATVDPFKGNLVLNDLVLLDHHGKNDTQSQSLNKIEKVWANYSISQLLYRRFYAPLILMDGVQIGSGDRSRSMLPSFESKARKGFTPIAPALANSPIDGIDAAIAKASFHRVLDQSTSRSAVTNEHFAEEMNRLKKAAQAVTSTAFDLENPLRSTMEAKRAQVELKKFEARLTELKQGLDRETARLTDSLPIARENFLVDWMGWNNAKLDEIDAINHESQVEMLFSDYAVEWIKPLVSPLITTHTLSRWCSGDYIECRSADAGRKTFENLDLSDAELRTAPFRFQIIRLRGRTLLGLEPLAMTGSIKQPVASKKHTHSAGPVTLDLQFDRRVANRPKLDTLHDGSVIASSTYDRTSHAHQIDLRYRLNQATKEQIISIGSEKHVVETTLRAANPCLKLNWTLRDDIWECKFEMDCSHFELTLNQLLDSREPLLLSKLDGLGKKSNANWQWDKQEKKAETAFFQVTYRGRLVDGRFDNSDETIHSAHSSALAKALREYRQQQTKSDLIAAKALWIERSERECTKWLAAHQSRIAGLRIAVDKFQSQIHSQQTQIAELLQDPSDARFSRKNSQEKSGTITR